MSSEDPSLDRRFVVFDNKICFNTDSIKAFYIFSVNLYPDIYDFPNDSRRNRY